MTKHVETPYLTIDEAAARLGVNRNWMVKAMRKGYVRYMRIGQKSIRLRTSDVDACTAHKVKLRSPRNSMPDHSGVYFLLSPLTGLVKIGHAKNINRRVLSIQTQCAEDLKLVAQIETDSCRQGEAWFHRWFDLKRIRFEWFQVSESEIEEAINLWRMAKK